MDSHIIYLIIGLIIAGLFAGYTGGLFGVGGGTVLVPVLLTLFPFFHTAHGVVMHVAVGTSLALLIPNTAIAAYRHYKSGNLEIALCKEWLPAILIGALVGVVAIKYMPTVYLKVIFTIYLYASFLFVLFKKDEVTEVKTVPRGWSMQIAGFLIGGFSLMLGIGGGAISVPYTQFRHYPMKKAIGFAALSGVFIGIIGTIGMVISGQGVVGRPPFSWGFVNLIAFIFIAPLVIAAAPFGVKAVNRLSKKHLRWLYSGFLLLMALYMTIELFLTSRVSV